MLGSSIWHLLPIPTVWWKFGSSLKVYAYHHGRKLYERLSAGCGKWHSKSPAGGCGRWLRFFPGDTLLIEREGQEQAGRTNWMGRIFRSDEVGRMNILEKYKMSSKSHFERWHGLNLKKNSANCKKTRWPLELWIRCFCSVAQARLNPDAWVRVVKEWPGVRSLRNSGEIPSLKLTVRPWKWMVGIRSFPIGLRPIFRGENVSFREGRSNWNPILKFGENFDVWRLQKMSCWCSKMNMAMHKALHGWYFSLWQSSKARKNGLETDARSHQYFSFSY